MKINIFGSTGIIGSKTLDIIDNYFPDIKINLLCSNTNVKKLINQIENYSPKYVYLNDSNKINYLKKNINNNIKILNFNELKSYLISSKSDLTLLAISGYKSLNYLEPIFINTKSLGLVSKEAVVSAGHLFKNFTKKNKNKIYPLDSEHFSIFQNMQNNNLEINNIKLTASGGPFLGKNYKSLKDISFSKASKHPKWNMGYKNSIDSATLVNKCLELVEAHYLFNIPFEKLDIVIHPESLIHSICEYNNYIYNFFAFQNDMMIPIFHFLNQKYKYILNNDKLRISKNTSFNFFNVKNQEFPVYKVFKNLNKTNPSNIIKFNVANEYAVNLFKIKHIKYTEILKIITKITSLNMEYKLNNIDDIICYHELLEIKISENLNYK
jgi:1-deoxy-D-xylulose-5-phosphate reductoisomerase